MAHNSDDAAQPYKFGGKEYDAMHGLNLYDFSARMQDPAVGRFTPVDPLAEKYYDWSLYGYCRNNRENRIDPTGMDTINVNGLKGMNNLDLRYMKDGDVIHVNLREAEVNDTKQTDESEWYSSASKISWGISTSASMLENGSGISRVGSNLRFYRPTAKGGVFYGNQYVKTASLAKIGKGIGGVMIFGAIIMDGVGVFNYYNNPNSPNVVHPGKAASNLAINLYGTINPYFSVPYFLVDSFYPGGWPAALEKNAQLEKENKKVVPGFQLIPYGPKW